MKLIWPFGIVIYTHRWIPSQHGAFIRLGFIVLMRPRYRHDRGLLEHERNHLRGFWTSPFTYWWKYKRDADYRLKVEVDCYLEQLKWCPDPLSCMATFAGYLADNYDLGESGMTRDNAYLCLKALVG